MPSSSSEVKNPAAIHRLRGLAEDRRHMQSGENAVRRVVQNEVLRRCVIPAKAGIQSPVRSQVWMPACAGMTLAFLCHLFARAEDASSIAA
jgi:hypothetical protein